MIRYLKYPIFEKNDLNMKTFLLTIVAISFFSCTKDYSCGCVYYTPGSDELKQKFEIKDKKLSDAEDYCAGQKASLEEELSASNVNCVLTEQ